MKRTILTFLCLANGLLFQAFAQQGVWTWMNGDSTANSIGVYGSQGVFAPGNTPPALYEACEWTDNQGNFWLFGGQDSTIGSKYSDLWEYKPSINQWAWIKGPGIVNQAGVYGVIQVPSPTNQPGARNFGWPSWVDTAGNFWMFSGYGYDVNGTDNELNDLWMYNIATNEWTWMKGPNTAGNLGNYGTFQTENVANNPPCRCEYSSGWRDSHNNLWLFGGASSNNTPLSDMWRYNIATNNWAWMKGPQTTSNPAVYGTKGVEAPNNIPSGRWSFGHWVDANDNLYFFGGTNATRPPIIPEVYNDMWRYNTTTNNWTWISGTSMVNDPGNYGPICIPDTGFWPPARFENRACWKRGTDNFVLYGGSGPGYNAPIMNDSTYNDVWNYNVTTKQWSWISGANIDQQTSVHGTMGVPNAANHPSARDGSNSWTDAQGNLWLFGGFQAMGYMYGEQGKVYNDLWRWTPDTVAPIPLFVGIPDSGCAPLTVNFINNSVNATNYYWDFGDGNNSVSFSPTHTYINPGTYTVKLIVSSNTPCSSGIDSLIKINYIVVMTAPTGTFTADTLNGCDSLLVHFTNHVTGGLTYSWRFGDGGTSTLPNPTHLYHNPGLYTDTLIAYGPFCNDTIIRVNYIAVTSAQSVSSAFVADTLSGCVPLTVTFTNNSVNGNAYHWSFGDGNTSTSASPVNIYTTPGTYTVKLVTYNISACGTVKDSSVRLAYITVYAIAHAAFTQDSVHGCAPLLVHFTNTSTNATSYKWNFGDNSTSTTNNPNHTYTNHGTYSITLIAYGGGGCNDTVIFNSIVVDTLPIVTSAFVADTLSGCNPFTVHFTNNSLNGVTYLWDFGDHTTSTLQTPTHTYTDSGIFTVKLWVINNSICGVVRDSTFKTSYIHVENPVTVHATFTGSPVLGCAPLNVSFINNSTNALHYIWYFGDGSSDTAKNPKHLYNFDINGYYTATLIVTHPGQKCPNPPDTMRLEIKVDSCYRYIPNVFSPNNDGYNDYFHVIAEGYDIYHLIIFNRWGLKVFESNDKANLWNGLINNTGGKAPDGTYYYIFNATDVSGVPFQDHGYLTLIR